MENPRLEKGSQLSKEEFSKDHTIKDQFKETMLEILKALAQCTENQRRRFLLYALEGLSYAEIGQLCGCSKVAVHYSIEAVRKKCKEFLTDYLNDSRFSG